MKVSYFETGRYQSPANGVCILRKFKNFRVT